MKKRTVFSLLFPVLFLLCCKCAMAQELKVGTFNLRYNNAGDSTNSWLYRKSTVIDLIHFYDFDILGTQEGLKGMIDDLQVGLADYDYVGVGRDDGKEAGEYAAIWFKKKRFKVLDKGTFWLNGVDIRQPLKGWDAALPRICTWVKLKDRESGKTFYHFNTHFDHVGVTARVESAQLIVAQIRKIAGENALVALTGDFNVDQHSDNYHVLNTSGLLRDAFETAAVKLAPNGTFNGFNINSHTDSRIDHVFLTKSFQVRRYGVLTNIYWHDGAEGRTRSDNFPKEVHLDKARAALPSDHYPVITYLSF